jgi:peptidoglycan/LPS O-acetylase OafA/YrhL
MAIGRKEKAMPSDRRHDIDHLRSLAVLLLVPFHTARLFDADPWHVKDLGRYPAADLLIGILNVVQMPLLFALAGAAMVLSLERRGPGRFLVERLGRILVPLVAGILIVVPPQVWVERISIGMPGRQSPIDWTGDYLAFYPRFFDCCYDHGNFSWHHLWFLVYLLVYSVVLLPVAAVAARRFAAAAPTARPWLGGWRVVLPVLPLALIEAVLRPRFGNTHALAGDWANHAHYLLVMGLGMIAFVRPADRAEIGRTLGRLGIAALVCGGLWLALRFGPPAPRLVRATVRVAAEWFAILAFAGLAARFLARPLPLLTAFAPLSLAFYVVHQTIIVLAGWYWRDWSDAPVAKAVVIAALTFALGLAVAVAARQAAPTRFLLGLPAPRPRPAI